MVRTDAGRAVVTVDTIDRRDPGAIDDPVGEATEELVVRTDVGRAVVDRIDGRAPRVVDDPVGEVTEERDADATDDREAAVEARVRPGSAMDSWERERGGRTGACEAMLAWERFLMVSELDDMDELRRSSCDAAVSRRAVVFQSCNLPETCLSPPPKNPLVDRNRTFTPGLLRD